MNYIIKFYTFLGKSKLYGTILHHTTKVHITTYNVLFQLSSGTVVVSIESNNFKDGNLYNGLSIYME